MKAEEKAKELIRKYRPYDVIYCDPLGNELDGYYERYAKQCALICIQERIDLLNELDDYFHEAGHDRTTLEKAMEYQQEVKQEIEKQ